jgi:hypothetical protein
LVNGIALNTAVVRRGALAAVATMMLLLCACSTDSTRWGRGKYEELKTYTSVEFRRGPTEVDPRTGELSIEWVGARAPEGYPRILDCHLIVFDDKNGNGEPDPGEILQERSSREVCRKVIFGDIHVLPSPASRTLMAKIELNTETRYRSVTWGLSSD